MAFGGLDAGLNGCHDGGGLVDNLAAALLVVFLVTFMMGYVGDVAG